MILATGEKWLMLGASRGLGLSVAEAAAELPEVSEIALVSRRSLSAPATSLLKAKSFMSFQSDFTNESGWEKLVEDVLYFQADRLFYFAGGGPYGSFEVKNWQDHNWAFKLNFLFPAFLLHHLLNKKASIKQISFIGSAIAESKPDPLASSYSASKHALKGLITSVQVEGSKTDKSNISDIRLFSPGYMDTTLLPKHAWPRQQPDRVMSVDKVSEVFLRWIQSAYDANTHFVVTPNSELK